jgi:hypothetical protein
MLTLWLVFAFVACGAASCASVVDVASAPVADPTPITIGGSFGGLPHDALFASAWYAYLVQVSSIGRLSVTQAAIGKYQALTGAVGGYQQTPLILHTIPTGSSTLHFLSISGTGGHAKLTDFWPPLSLKSVLPAGFVPTASVVSLDPNVGAVEDLFFASSDIVVRICLNQQAFPPNMLAAFSVVNMTAAFGNQLALDTATHIGVEELSARMFVSRARAGSSPDDAAEIVTLTLTASCGMAPDNRVFVQPQPVAVTVAEGANNAGAYMYWPMASNSGGRLYRWDLLSKNVANISLGLGANDEFSPVGFAQVRDQAWYGVVASVISSGDPQHVHVFEVACKAHLAVDLPTAYAAVSGQSVVFASGAGNFSLVKVPEPTTSSRSRSVFSHRRRNALGACQAVPFGLPSTCAGCMPPAAVCGMTEHCASGCCFVQGGHVMCCTQSPPGLKPGFSCA